MSDTNTEIALSSDRNLAAVIGKNTIFGVASSAVQIGTRFVTVPIVIYHLGLGGYGIWSIIMVTAAYMRFGTAGLKSAFQKYVAEATGNGDFETASKLLSTGSISMLLLSVAGLIPIALFSQKLAAISGVPPEFLMAAASSITLLAFIMVVSNFGAAYEAIVMGGHRIDLTRKFTMVSTAGEAVAIIILLHFGYGLFAMAGTIAVSELFYIFCCSVAAKRILPQIHISARHFTRSVFHELIRFAGSYQLVNILEVLYGMLVPVILLKYFGAAITGAFALVSRVVSAALIGQDALILPILSGGTMVFASGSSERLIRFFKKSFKITVAVTLAPLGFLMAFGALVILGWTGQGGPEFRVSMWLLCVGGFFSAISRLQLILYRASGRAFHDNVRSGFRLAVLLVLAFWGRALGFYGILAGLVLSELAGIIYMFFAMSRELPDFSPRMFIPDTMKVAAATILTLSVGLLAAMLPTPLDASVRTFATIKLAEASLACLLAALPAIMLTKSMSNEEQRAVIDLLVPWRRTADAAQD